MKLKEPEISGSVIMEEGHLFSFFFLLNVFCACCNSAYLSSYVVYNIWIADVISIRNSSPVLRVSSKVSDGLEF